MQADFDGDRHDLPRRWLDNVFVERLWRSLKYEEVHLKAYANGLEARIGIGQWFRFYNECRPHQGVGYKTPAAAGRPR
jgi:putative transposase